jgi:hypothetical protein
MATSHRVYSDLFAFSDYVQQVAVAQGKNLLIDALREYFKNDLLYRYTPDAFGFPLTPNVTDLPPDIQEERTTRLYIGDIFRLDKRYWPAIAVRYSSGKYHPVSFNQNLTTRYRLDLVLDGYGNRSYIRVPTHKVIAGAWDQSFEVLIASEAVPDREELTDIVSSFLIGTTRQQTTESGLFIKSVAIGAEREEDWGNEKVYLQSITVETYSEWRREIPIDANDLMDTINFCFNYGVLGSGSYSTDITVVTTEDNTIRVEIPT